MSIMFQRYMIVICSLRTDLYTTRKGSLLFRHYDKARYISDQQRLSRAKTMLPYKVEHNCKFFFMRLKCKYLGK
jgi:hypothetical protein